MNSTAMIDNGEDNHDGRAESAYRRGYHQAIETVLDALMAGASVDDLVSYAEQVRHWRTNAAPIVPPAIRRTRMICATSERL